VSKTTDFAEVLLARRIALGDRVRAWMMLPPAIRERAAKKKFSGVVTGIDKHLNTVYLTENGTTARCDLMSAVRV
jgi:hypothetical protein